VGIIAVLQAFSFSAQATGLSCDYLNAVLLAEDKIQELEFRERQDTLKEESANGSNDKFSWKYSLNLDRELNLYKLDFDITWQRAHRQESLSVNTYFK